MRVELEMPPAASLEDTQVLALPQRAGIRHRTELPPPVRLINVVTDPILLRRLLAGLRQLPTGRSDGEDTTNPDTESEDR